MNEDEPYFKIRMEAQLKNGILKECRIKLDMSQKEVAKLIGIPQEKYGAIERMQVYPDDHSIEEICHFFKLDRQQVFPEQLRSLAFQKVYVATKNIMPSQLESMTEEHGLLAESIDRDIEKDDLAEEINSSLKKLKDNEADVIRRLYGLSPYEKSHNLLEIAKIYNQSSANIALIRDKALRKIRKHSKGLRSYLG